MVGEAGEGDNGGRKGVWIAIAMTDRDEHAWGITRSVRYYYYFLKEKEKETEKIHMRSSCRGGNFDSTSDLPSMSCACNAQSGNRGKKGEGRKRGEGWEEYKYKNGKLKGIDAAGGCIYVRRRC